MLNRAADVIVSGGFDDLRSRHLRVLEEAAKFGELTVLLWLDEVLEHHAGVGPGFPLAERLCFLNAVRHVSRVVVATGCYDWLHTGHVRFTEEVSADGDLYVIVGHDASIRRLKPDMRAAS